MHIERKIDPEEQTALLNYLAVRKTADRAKRFLEEAEEQLLKVMEAKRQKSFSYSEDGTKYSVTYTQRTENKINEAALRKALTARVYDAYVVKKLDRKSLENAMSSGEVDPMVVARYVDQVPGKPFLTYREKEETSGEAEGV